MTDLFSKQQEPGCSWCGPSEYGKKDTVETHENDIALAKEMNELSVQEREKVFDDVHGVAKVQEETPEFMAKALEAMDDAIAKIPVKKRKALDRAFFLKPSILSDLKFKLMFLRADLYDAKKAAKRLSRHFEEKLKLFGEERMVKKITLADLEEEDLELLNLVGCVLLPHQDQTGRPIWFFDMTKFEIKNHLSMLRCFWYLVMTTAEDETAQLKGVCNVAYCPGDLLAMPAKIAKLSKMMVQAGPLQEGFPIRITAFQFCYDDPRVRYLESRIGHILGKPVRLRLRSHFGSDLEMQYSLMTFGISCHYLFHSAGGEEKVQLRRHFIQRRREIERLEEEARIEEEARSGIILHPQPLDVLVGRGRPYQEFPGNQRLGTFVEAKLDRVRQARNRFEKTCIFLEVVKTVQDSGGRFLQKTDEGWWKVATDKVAREKTCSAFRSKLGKALDDEIKSSEAAEKADLQRSTKRIRYDPAVAA